jgi:membrane associated rhomboid family serine protease
MPVDHPTPREAAQPIFNIPPVTGMILAVEIAIHLLRLLLPYQLDNLLIGIFAFIPARFTLPGAFDWAAIVSPLTYQLLHAGFAHLAMNMLALLAFGAGLEIWMGGGRMLGFAILCGFAAAGAHLAVYPESTAPLIGASGAISGIFGGLLRTRLATQRGRLWPLVAIWVVMTVITGEAGMPGTGDQPIAWVAHLGGFAAGLALVGFFRPRRIGPGSAI